MEESPLHLGRQEKETESSDAANTKARKVKFVPDAGSVAASTQQPLGSKSQASPSCRVMTCLLHGMCLRPHQRVCE